MKPRGAIEAGASRAIIKVPVSWIGVAVSIVAAGVAVGAWVGVGYGPGHAAPSVLHSSGVKIALVDGLESLLALRGVNPNGIDQAEAQGLFRFKDRGTAAREQHCAATHCRAGSRADGPASAPFSGCPHQPAEF